MATPGKTGNPVVDIGNPADVGGGGAGGTVAQGEPNADIAKSWPVEMTDGVNVLGTAGQPVRTDPTGTTTQPVSAVALPLPAGAATEAGNLATIAGDTTSVDGKMPADPAREGGNLATIAGDTTSIDGKVPADPAREGGNLATIAGDTTSIDGKIPADPAKESGKLTDISAAIGSAAAGLLKNVSDYTAKIPSKGTAAMAGSTPVTLATDDVAGANLTAMATCRPGLEAVGDVSVAKDAATHTIATATVVNSYYDLEVQPDLTDYAAPAYRRVRIAAPGPALASSKWYSTNSGTFRVGPLAIGETVAGWVDAAEPAAVVVSCTRGK